MGLGIKNPAKEYPVEYYSDNVLGRLGERPRCFRCGKEAVKVDDVWVCPQCDSEEDMNTENDVKDQDYYTRNGLKAKDIISDLLTFLDLGPYESWIVGNVIKYICRYPFKGSWNKDLAKAQEYLDWLKLE